MDIPGLYSTVFYTKTSFVYFVNTSTELWTNDSSYTSFMQHLICQIICRKRGACITRSDYIRMMCKYQYVVYVYQDTVSVGRFHRRNFTILLGKQLSCRFEFVNFIY